MTTHELAPTLLALAAGLALACANVSETGLASGAPAPADIKPAKWNQERVTTIAADLADAVADLRDVVRDDPASNIGSGQSNARHRLLYSLRLLKNESAYLAKELKAGSGRSETLPTYERLGTLSRDAREEARKIFLHEAIMGRITRAGDLWRQLSPYYVGAEG